MDGLGGDKYIYPCICITAYSCWAVCSLGPTVLEAEGSALIGKGSLSSHSEAKVSGATVAPPPHSPHQLCRAECTRFSIPPSPHGAARAAASSPAPKGATSHGHGPLPGPRTKRCPQVQRACCASVSPFPQTSSPCPCHRPGPPPPRRGPLCYPCLALASQVTAIKMNSKYIQIPLSDIREGDGARAGQLARPPQDTGLCLVGQDPAVAGWGPHGVPSPRAMVSAWGGDLVSPAVSPLAPQAPAGFPPPARKALKLGGFGTHW